MRNQLSWQEVFIHTGCALGLLLSPVFFCPRVWRPYPESVPGLGEGEQEAC